MTDTRSSPAPLTDEERTAFREWVDQNPLRRWRFSHQPRQLPILEAAQRFGVGMSMIQMWERGVHRPGPTKMKVLAHHLGDSVDVVWDEWLASKPA